MNWSADFSKLKTVDVLIMSTAKQYIAGQFIRNSDGTVFFKSSDSAWTLMLSEIKKYSYIT